MAKTKLSFEQAMEKLDAIVKQLEKGEAPLNEALALFEEGTALISACGKLLDEAEQKVVILKKGEDGAPLELPFEDGE